MKINKKFKHPISFFSSGIFFICILVIIFLNFCLAVANSKTKNTPIIKSKAVNINSKNTSEKILLKIPTLKISTTLEQVGLNSTGAVDVPKDFLKAAWFNGSVKPGLVGNAVIVGHFGKKSGVWGVFSNLSKLKKGDKIYIDSGGKSIVFIVQRIQIYNKDLKVSEIFISSDNKEHLNLITCDGVWNKTAKNYLDRLVIFADRE